MADLPGSTDKFLLRVLVEHKTQQVFVNLEGIVEWFFRAGGRTEAARCLTDRFELEIRRIPSEELGRDHA